MHDGIRKSGYFPMKRALAEGAWFARRRRGDN